MKKFLAGLCLGIGLMSYGVDAQAATINVPADYPTIQEAINAAINFDTVLVGAGTYIENINFKGKAITVKSVYGPASTIIDGNKKDSVVKFSSGENIFSVLDGFTITNGLATDGGGIYCNSSFPTITNCTISGNSANVGGGICCYYSYPTITNCTISGNSANSATQGGGIYCYYSYPSTVVNSIFWDDSPQEIYLSYASINITYSDIKGGWAGTGNINSNPLFVGDGDYHLQSNSPCIDAGSNTALGIPASDKDGNPRIVNGVIDMGAYEFQGITIALSITKTVDIDFGSPGSTLNYGLSFKNRSATTVTNVKITDPIPAYTTYIENSATGGGYYSQGQVIWNMGSLAPDAEGFVSFKVKINENTPNKTPVENNAKITCNEATSAVISNYAITIVKDSLPTIAHEAIKFWGTPSTSIEIKAVITDDVKVESATLHYRKKEKEETSFTSVTMTNVGNTYTETIPAGYVTIEGVEYYIEAKDNSGKIVSDGSSSTPHFISVGYPVLLVHGYRSNSGMWNDFRRELEKEFKVDTIDLAPHIVANGDIKNYANLLELEIINLVTQTGAPKVDIVAHSMGGLVSRWYIQHERYHNNVRKLIMIATPNHGTPLVWSHLLKLILDIKGEGIGEAGRQMQPPDKDSFISELNGHTKWGKSESDKTGKDKGVSYYTIAGTNFFSELKLDPIIDEFFMLSNVYIGLSYITHGEISPDFLTTDGVVSVASVELGSVPSTKYFRNHLEIYQEPDVWNQVESILKNESNGYKTSMLSASPLQTEGTASTLIQELPMIDGKIYPGGTISHHIMVDPASEVHFLLNWDDGEIGFTLTTPNGDLIEPASATTNPDITYFATTTIKGYTIKNPEAGT